LSDENSNVISTQIRVGTNEAEQKFETIAQKLKQIENNRDRLVQQTADLNKADASYLEQLQKINTQLQQLARAEESLITQREKLKSLSADNRDKSLQAEATQRKAIADAELKQQQQISDLKAKQSADANRQYWMDEENARKRRTEQLKTQMQVQPSAVPMFAQQLRDARDNAEQLYRKFQETGLAADKLKFTQARDSFRDLTQQSERFNKSIGESTWSLNNMERRLSSHLTWIAGGMMIGGTVGMVSEAIDTITKLDTEFNQLKTVSKQMEENQFTFNNVISDSFHLAQKYGAVIKDVTDGLRLWGRGYKELSDAQRLNELGIKIGIADNFSPEVANKAIESVISSYGKQSEAIVFGTHVMDAMTKVSHNAQVSANDLSEGLLRSAAAAKTVGVGFDELNAMIGTIARNTGLSGQTIGDGIKSILNSIHSKKAIEELDKMGIAVKKVGKDGQTEFRKITDVLLDVALKAPIAGQNVEAAFRQLAGGERKLAA
jgi:TP901 family phage tail tape measure protein